MNLFPPRRTPPPPQDDKADVTTRRLIRIETKLSKLMEHLGAGGMLHNDTDPEPNSNLNPQRSTKK